MASYRCNGGVNMNDKIFNKALWTCCKMSVDGTCHGCPLYPLKIGEDGTLNFLCLSNHEPTHKAAEDAIKKVVKDNPKVFPEDVVRAIIKQARVV